MKSLNITGAAAAILLMTAAAGSAQAPKGPQIGDGTNMGSPQVLTYGGGAAAHIGDGPTDSGTPPYNVGSGAAHVGDGTGVAVSNPSGPQPFLYTPGNGAARVGSETNTAPPNAPAAKQ